MDSGRDRTFLPSSQVVLMDSTAHPNPSGLTKGSGQHWDFCSNTRIQVLMGFLIKISIGIVVT